MSSAVDLINVVCVDITELRSEDDKYNELSNNAATLCEQCGIEWSLCDEADSVASRPPNRKRKVSSRLLNSVLETVIGQMHHPSRASR